MDAPDQDVRSNSAARDRGGIARWRTPALPWIVLLILVSIAYGSVMPPSPLDRNAPVDQFSAERAFDHVQAIATGPHPIGSAAIEGTRAYIVGELEKLGLQPELQSVPATDYFGNGGPIEVVNILAVVPGSDDAGTIALVAHYDTHPATPGANDNSAAVAALLETGRALLAGPPPGRDVLLLFTDGEEPAPRFGSNGFVTDHPAVAKIVFVLNLEANGGSGASILAETSGPQGWLIEELEAAGGSPAAFSFLTETAELIGEIGTDFDSFRRNGIAGMHFAYLRGSPIYHTEADNIDAVGRGSLQHHGEHALDLARHLGALDPSSAPDGDAVFFTVRDRLLRYPAAWALPLGLFTSAICLAVTILSARRTGTTGSALARSAGHALLLGLATTVGGTVIWVALVALRSTPGVLESYLYLFGLLAAASWILVRTGDRRIRPTGTTVLVLGSLSLVTGAAAPGFSYLFTWPALAGAAAIFGERRSHAAASWIRFLVVAIPTVILMTPAIDLFFQFAQPRPGNPDSSLTYLVALPIMLTLLAAAVLRRVWPQPAGSINHPVPEAAAAGR